MKRIYKLIIVAIVALQSAPSFAQSLVSGKVTDANDGTGLPGVTIQLKGSPTVGTITGLDGSYSLNVPENSTLIFSYIGYVTEEVLVGDRTIIDVPLAIDVEELSEVVVIGYGQVEEGDITGVVNKVDSKEFNQGQLTSPDQLLAGKVAGVQISANSGEPGGGNSIRIRGGTSLGASSDPLFVVDGIPLSPNGVAGGRNPLNFINPNDIQDITVLKDASAAAIYGSRGANGVIIITTKGGKKGLQITVDQNFSVSEVVDRVDMLTTDEFRFVAEDRFSPYLPQFGGSDTLGRSDTDWYDAVLQTANANNTNIGVAFGGTSTSGRVSFNYQEVEGVLKTSSTERFNISSNITQKLFNDDLTLTFTSKSSLIYNRFAPVVIGSALIFDPTQSIYNPENVASGGYFEWRNSNAPGNPVAQIDQTFNIGRNFRNLVGGTAEYKIPFVQGLSFKVNYSYDLAKGRSQNTQLENPNSETVASNGANRPLGFFSYFEEERESELLETYLNYGIETGVGKLDLIAGYSNQSFDFRQPVRLNNQGTVQVPINELGLNSSHSRLERFLKDDELNDIEPLLFVPNPNETENRLISYWGRANFAIQDKYLLTATIRRDGSTRFGRDNRWGLFPSAALGWRIMDEPFAQGLESVFSTLKLRVSWGITGNQEIADYAYIGQFIESDDGAQYILGNDTLRTFRPDAVDPNIKWEETSSINFGLDFGFFKGRLYGTLDYYEKYTNDLLFDIAFPIGTLTGDRAITNIGEMENKGVELQLNAITVDKPDLRVDLTFNAAYNKNEITKLDNSNLPDFQGYQDLNSFIAGDVGQTIQILKVGESVKTFFVYEHLRDEAGNPVNDNTDTDGDGDEDLMDMYVDQNKDGVINEDDLRPYKNALPDWILGFTGTASYKNFDLAFTLRSQLGNYVYNNVESQYGNFEGIDGDLFAPANIHSSALEYDFDDRQLFSDVYVEDGSFLKLDNITLGYTFDFQKSMRLRTYFTASNLLVITGYRGLDPELGTSGIDNNIYPRSRTFLLGVNLTIN